MKKLFALLMTGAMLLSGSAAAFAGETEAVAETENAAGVMELNWSDIEEVLTAQGIEGEMTVLGETGLQMFVPAELEAMEIDEDLAADGYIAMYKLGEAGGVLVEADALDGLTLEEYIELLEADEDIYDLETALVNGIPAVSCSAKDEEDGEVGIVSVVGADDMLVTFMFDPVDNEDFAPVAAMMVASIQEAA